MSARRDAVQGEPVADRGISMIVEEDKVAHCFVSIHDQIIYYYANTKHCQASRAIS